MGRISGPTSEDRFGVYGQPEMSGGDRTNHKSRRVPTSLCHRPWVRRGRQRNDTVYDVTAQVRSNNTLLQQTIRQVARDLSRRALCH